MDILQFHDNLEHFSLRQITGILAGLSKFSRWGAAFVHPRNSGASALNQQSPASKSPRSKDCGGDGMGTSPRLTDCGGDEWGDYGGDEWGNVRVTAPRRLLILRLPNELAVDFAVGGAFAADDEDAAAGV